MGPDPQKALLRWQEISTSLLISRERGQHPPPQGTVLGALAGRLGQANCCKGHHRHRRTLACCIVPLDEQRLITQAR